MKEITFGQLKQLIKEAYDYEDVMKGKRAPEKFYIVAERDNPQLGIYLSNVYIGKRRDKDGYIICSFDYYGSRKSLKFYFGMNDGKHNCTNPGNSLYGSMDFYGFDSAEEAKDYLKRNWSKSINFDRCMNELNRDELTTEAKRYARDCYAINIRDYHTGMHNLYTGTKDTMYKLEEIIKRIDHIVHYKDGTTEELEALYDEINTYDYDVLEEIDWRKIDNDNDYYEPFSEKTYHIINNTFYDMW